MTGALVAGLLAGYGVALPVGAVAAYLVSLAARTSLRVGAAAALGVATADGLYALAAVLGGVAAAAAVRPVAEPLRWAAAVVLVGLAARVAVGAVRRFRAGTAAGPAPPAPPGPARAFLVLLGITLVNPLTVVYFVALVLGAQAGVVVSVAERVVFVGAAFAASASWQLVLAGGGAALGRAVTGSRGRLSTALASAALIAGLALAQLA